MRREQAPDGVRLRLGGSLPGARYTRVFPFRRRPWIIAIVAAIDLAFLLPAAGVFQQAASAWANSGGLFDLVMALFLSGWLLGWSLAPLVLSLVLLVLLFGREVLGAGPDRVSILMGLPLLGVQMDFAPSRLRNLRVEQAVARSGKSWRGSHLAFDYGNGSFALGSDIPAAALAPLRHELELAIGIPIRQGPPDAGEPVAEPVSAAPAAFSPPQAQNTAPGPAAPLSLSSPSTLALIAANLLPLLGAALWGWNLGDVMVLYWAETAIIGLFNVVKIIIIGRWAALLAGPFFIGHFGAFMAVHFLFINLLFLGGPQSGGDRSTDEVLQMFQALAPALLALLVSHGFSFVHNFLGRQEYRSRSINQQMSEPYSRVIFMHLVIIFGGGVALVLGEPTLVIMAVIAVKIALDVRAHLREHRPDTGSGQA